MKPLFSTTLLFLGLLFTYSCKKSDPVSLPQPPAELADSTLKINAITKLDAGEFEVSYASKPPLNEQYENLSLVYSTHSDFREVTDSLSLFKTVNTGIEQKHVLTGLKQGSDYFVRLSVKYRGKVFYSEIKPFRNDSLVIMTTDHTGLFSFRAVERGMNIRITTNAGGDTTKSYNVNAKVFLGDNECMITKDKGSVLYYTVPQTIPPGTYKLRLERKGLTAYYADSIHIVQGKWRQLTSLNLPLNAYFSENALFDFGTCYSETKGYIVGGLYFRSIQFGSPEWGNAPDDIFEFDPNTNAWIKRRPASPKYFERPVCYYYNNAIYVLGGMETDKYGGGFMARKLVKNIWKLDLASLTWSQAGNIPFSKHNLVSFQINGEWYLGLGSDEARDNNGNPLISKELWKYTPSTGNWKRLADFPGPHHTFPTAFTIGNKAYVFLGMVPEGDFYFHSTNYGQELWEYDTETDTWLQKPLPSVGGPLVGEKYQIVTYNGKAYFLTAQEKRAYLSGYGYSLQRVFLEYDPATNKFTTNINRNNQVDMMRLVYKNGNRFIFQSDALGYIENVSNRTDELIIE